MTDDILTFAQLSDPHLSSLHHVTIGQLLSKRILGYLSWKFHRQADHRREVLVALERDLQNLHPQHIVITGDLTHLGLPEEFQEVRDWLHQLGPPSDITVIPGNHDAYVWTPPDQTFALWAPYMASDPFPAVSGTAMIPHNGSPADAFPTLRLRGSVAFIGLSSALPTGPFLATGHVGSAQLIRLATLLRDTRERHLFRIILIHHPPALESIKWRKRLTDHEALQAVLAQEGAELILHGHAHRSSFVNLPSPNGVIPAIGVPSASYVGKKTDRTAEYHFYRLSRSSNAWNLDISVRGYSVKQDRFEARHHTTITIPFQHPTPVVPQPTGKAGGPSFHSTPELTPELSGAVQRPRRGPHPMAPKP